MHTRSKTRGITMMADILTEKGKIVMKLMKKSLAMSPTVSKRHIVSRKKLEMGRRKLAMRRRKLEI